MNHSAGRFRARRVSSLSPIAEAAERTATRLGEEGGLRPASVSELGPIARASVPAVRIAPPAPPAAMIPIILRATLAEAKGARMRIAGVRLVDRAIRQLARFRDARVVVATDGSVPLPRRLPGNMERRELGEDVETDLEILAAELGPDTVSVGADSVWLQPRRFDRAVRVTDPASRRVAAAAIFGDLDREGLGIADRLVHQRIANRLVRHLISVLPVTPVLLSLVGGMLGLWGASIVALGGWQSAVAGFAALEGYVLLCAASAELGRVRLGRSRLAAWVDTVIGDLVSTAAVLAVGLSLWKRGGTYLDMKIALVAAALTIVQAGLVYRELRRQREADVTRLRWWFAYGQSLRGLGGAGSTSIKVMLALGRRDLVFLAGLVLVCFDQLPIVLLHMLVVAIVRAAGAVGQVLTPEWRLRLRP